MKKRIAVLSIVLLLVMTLTVTYAWLVLETVAVDIKVPSATVTLDLEADTANNAKQLVPTKFYWLTSQTNEYRFTITSTNLAPGLSNVQKKEFYQELLNTYTISLSGEPEKVSLKDPIATSEGIKLVVFLDDADFKNFGDYRSWRNPNKPLTFGFSFTLK